MRDDDLLDALSTALHDAPAEPEAHRIDALRAAVEARRDAAAAPTSLDERRKPRTAKVSVAAAAAAVAIVLGGVALIATEDDAGGEVEYAGAIDGDVGTGELSVVKTDIGRVVEVDTDDLEILPAGEFYEVWFVGPGDTLENPNRISAGTFHPRPDGVTDVTLAAAVDPALYPLVEITAEPGDGDPSPSGIVLLSTDIGG